MYTECTAQNDLGTENETEINMNSTELALQTLVTRPREKRSRSVL